MNKATRILTTLTVSLVLGCQFAYRDSHANGQEYQAHPIIVVMSDFFCGSLSGLIFYFGSGWFANRKNKKRDEVEKNKFYDQVALELQQKTLIAGLWTKAYAEMDGDEAKARALYIRYRVQQLLEISKSSVSQDQQTQASPSFKATRNTIPTANKINYSCPQCKLIMSGNTSEIGKMQICPGCKGPFWPVPH